MSPPPRASLATTAVMPSKGTATLAEPLPSPPGPPAPAPAPVPPPAAVAPAAAVQGPPAREGTVSMNLRMPPGLQRKLKVLAFETETPATQIILSAIRAYLGETET